MFSYFIILLFITYILFPIVIPASFHWSLRYSYVVAIALVILINTYFYHYMKSEFFLFFTNPRISTILVFYRTHINIVINY